MKRELILTRCGYSISFLVGELHLVPYILHCLVIGQDLHAHVFEVSIEPCILVTNDASKSFLLYPLPDCFFLFSILDGMCILHMECVQWNFQSFLGVYVKQSICGI